MDGRRCDEMKVAAPERLCVDLLIHLVEGGIHADAIGYIGESSCRNEAEVAVRNIFPVGFSFSWPDGSPQTPIGMSVKIDQKGWRIGVNKVRQAAIRVPLTLYEPAKIGDGDPALKE